MSPAVAETDSELAEVRDALNEIRQSLSKGQPTPVRK
jgi:hypothetical protein